jgi:CheY-like chemotaxis protein
MKKPRILSVDDEASFTELLKQYFEPRGYEIDVASAGDDALEMARTKEYDVALLDLKMSGIDGAEVMRGLKERIPGIKVIFITAYSDSGKTKDKLIEEGAYGLLEKPVTSLKELEALVNKAAGLNE